MNDSVDGVPKSEIMSFKKEHQVQPMSVKIRKCEYCEKDLTGDATKYTREVTKRVAYKKFETRTIDYCSNCKTKNNF